MARITDLEIGDVRCFEGAQTARTRRITLLVGENGAGKSTFLGCYQTLAKLANLHDLAEENHFDDPPFRMGPFDAIVRTGKTSFTVGGRFADHCHDRVTFEFHAVGDRPVDRAITLQFRDNNGTDHDVRFTTPAASDALLRVHDAEFSFDLLPGELSFRSVSTWLSRYVRHGHLPFAGDPKKFRQARGESHARADGGFAKLVSLLAKELQFPDADTVRAVALEPTLPPRERHYGAAPGHLAGGDDGALLRFLADIGRELGLWQGVRIQHGLPNDGARVVVDTPGGPFNLVDVGYGVHGLLTTLSAIYGTDPKAVLLLQQPEIHVHPRAQAALAQWMAKSGRSFVIETHSDHLVKRFRICVMKEILDPDDLSIIYFEPGADGARSRMHSISVDPQGNLEGEPASYRDFFLKETKALLGF